MPMHLDVRTLPCPGPVMELRRLLDEGALTVTLHVADDLARSNVTRFAGSRGAEARSEPHPDGGFLVTVTAAADGGTPPGGEEPEFECEVPTSGVGSRVVQLTAPVMGTGDDELGGLLMRGFLKTLASVEPRPDLLLCYNGAAALCCEGSTVLGDLRALEALGVEILACGTCLNFFGIADKLEVGRVTDMLEIVSTLTRAGHVVRP